MKTLSLIQGTDEWKAHRATAFNASDAPAMLGISQYKSRSDLIKERATGIIPEVDSATQRLFDDGHRFEANARLLAEHIIGESLSPVTGTSAEYSASFDGITFDELIIFEHKTLNNGLRETLKNGSELDEQYRAQMEHQLMVANADKCLFMASTWDNQQNIVEELHRWYLPDPLLRARIVAGWEQFKKDVAAYVPSEIVEPPKAEAIQALPAVFVQATGMVTASNLSEFKKAATSFIAAIKTELITDQDFSDAESTVKFCKEAEGNLDQVKANVLAQMSTVDEVVRTLDHIKKQLADKRLMLDKLVKSEKESRKLAIVNEAIASFNSHLAELEAEIKPIRIIGIKQDFASAISGLKSLKSMQDKVGTALANSKIALDTEAADIRKKLSWLGALFAEHGDYDFLFSDKQALITKPRDDFELAVRSRIRDHKTTEAAKLEAERASIHAEEEAKARAKVEAEAKAAQAQIETNKAIQPAIANISKLSPKPSSPRANRAEILQVLAENFGLPEEVMLDWILAEFAGDIQFTLA